MAKKPASIKARKSQGGSGSQGDLLKQIDLLTRKLESRDKQIARLTGSKSGQQGKQKYFDEKALSVRLGVGVKTLQNWRGQGKGPRFYKIGRSVRYRLRDILAYEKSLPSGGGKAE